MRGLDYQRLDHGIKDSTPIRIKHDVWMKCGPGLRDMHYEVELGVVLTGEMRREHAGWRETFKPGSLWLGGIWEPHSAEVVRAPLELVMFHIQPDMLAQMSFPEAPQLSWLNLFTRPPGERPHPLAVGKKRGLAFGERMKALSTATDSWQVKLQFRLLLMEFLMELMEYAPPRPADRKQGHNRLDRAVELALLHHTRVAVSEAAHAVGMNRNEFSRAFRELMGIGFKEFQLHHRLRIAAEELCTLDIPLKTIALKWGFTDKSHFHHHFLRVFGCTPGEYRKRSMRKKTGPLNDSPPAPGHASTRRSRSSTCAVARHSTVSAAP